MGKIEYFIVEFYGGKTTFYPGEALNGTLRVKVNKELKLRGIRLEFHGKAHIHWSETTGSGEHRRTRHYSNSETYINTMATLFGKGKFGISSCVCCYQVHLIYFIFSSLFSDVNNGFETDCCCSVACFSWYLGYFRKSTSLPSSSIYYSGTFLNEQLSLAVFLGCMNELKLNFIFYCHLRCGSLAVFLCISSLLTFSYF